MNYVILKNPALNGNCQVRPWIPSGKTKNPFKAYLSNKNKNCISVVLNSRPPSQILKKIVWLAAAICHDKSNLSSTHAQM